VAALEITHLFAQIGWREMESGTPFEHREGGATSKTLVLAAENQQSKNGLPHLNRRTKPASLLGSPSARIVETLI